MDAGERVRDERYEIREHPALPGAWEITATSHEEVYIVLFGGSNAEARAKEYLSWKGGWA